MHDIILKIAKSNMTDKTKLEAITAIVQLKAARKSLYKARVHGAAQKRIADELSSYLSEKCNK